MSSTTTATAKVVARAPALQPWQLDFSAFEPTNNFYSASAANANTLCHVCEDFSEIDKFAAMCTLDKLNKLCSGNPADQSRPLDRDAKVFDARILFQRYYSFMDRTQPRDVTLEQVWKDLEFYNPSFTDLKGKLGEINKDYTDVITYLTKQREVANAAGRPAPEIAAIDAQLRLADDRHYSNTKLYNDRGKLCLEELGKCLWSNFSRLREAKLGALAPQAQVDNVAKARLIFAWVALSIKYDDALTKVPIGQRGTDNVRTGNFLIKRTEVCQLYARAFQWMFNAIAAQLGGGVQPAEATYITGLSRSSYGGTQKENFPIDKGSHAWASFPLHSAAVPDSEQYKLIDPTWATATSLDDLDKLWWSMPSNAFKWSHLQTDNQSTANRDNWVVWYNAAQPNIPAVGQRYLRYIDHSTLNQPTLAAGSDNGNITISFRNACVHQTNDLAMRGFYLGATSRSIIELLDDPPSFKLAEYTRFIIPPASGANVWSARLRESDVPSKAWIAILACVDAHTGELGMYNPGLKQKFVPVVYWTFDRP